jgi:hypothetical protein
MSNESLYVGIELAAAGIRVVASSGQRVTISGARSQDPGEWLELALYGLAGVNGPVYATVAAPVTVPQEERERIVRAGRGARFEGVFVCSTPHALARGVERHEGCIAVVVDPEATSVALVRSGASSGLDQDHVRPIAGREAREIAVTARCLLKNHPRDVQRRLLRCAVVTGDEDELERIGRNALLRELEGIGASAQLVAEPFTVAAGAERLAFEIDQETWHRLATPSSRQH